MECDPTLWTRAGSGREFQFFATDEEIQACLESALPSDLGPWIVVALDILGKGKHASRELTLAEPRQFVELLSPTDRYRLNFWLASQRLSAQLLELSPDTFEDAANVCGVIVLQHGRRHGDRNDYSRISMLDRVQNTETGETRAHPEYSRAYESLRSALRALLVCSTVYTFPDGHDEENQRRLMSKGVVDRIENGTPYTSLPGRPLDE